MADESIITIKHFSKKFGNTRVIEDLSFEVKRGEIFAFLGANGSGKTTTIRSLLGMYQHDEGELLVAGKQYSTEMSGMLGYLPEERGLYTSSRVLETLVYFGRIKGLEASDAEKRALEYLERVELSDKRDTEIKKLSSGQQQKIQLGITVINSPELLVLDEPTKGLDPVNRDLLLDMLLELNRSGSTIVFSTHQMEEAEKIAERLVMIKDGKRALYGTLQEVKESFGTHMVRVRFEGKIPENDEMYTARVENRYAEIEPQNNCTPQDILKYLITKEVKITHFEVSAPSLHTIFVKVSKDNA